ncbi:MAG: Na/Pi cotransporter family protein [Bacteroidetes bacterium]|nr:Na/Pi cotransporter family protein [Bacteroidota bacterium]
MEASHNITPSVKDFFLWKIFFRSVFYFLIGLFIFLFSVDMMVSSLHRLGGPATEILFSTASNPFLGLFVGLLLTALIQSSSATTSLAIAMMVAGSISLSGAVPIIMGANIGTTITSLLVSLSFIQHKKEFRRAVAAGSYHAFFNILTALILFPLEFYFHFLSGLSHFLATTFFNLPTPAVPENFSLMSPLVHFISEKVGHVYWLAGFSVLLLLGSILFFRKVITGVIGVGSQEKFHRIFFKNKIKSFVWGLLSTAAIRSSSVTTSLVVPLAAKKNIKLRQAVAFILGANIGTTISAFLVSAFNTNAAIDLAIAHFLFNFIGVIFFFQTPYLKTIPYRLASGLGRLTLRYRLAGFLFLLVIFFLIPFFLLYLSR